MAECDRSAVFHVTAYDEGGYGDDRSRKFTSGEEAVKYARSLHPRYGAVVTRYVTFIPQRIDLTSDDPLATPLTDYARGHRAGQVAMRERAADAGYAVANDAANGAGKLWTKDYWDGDTPDAGRVLDGLPTEVPTVIRALPVEDGNGG